MLDIGEGLTRICVVFAIIRVRTMKIAALTTNENALSIKCKYIHSDVRMGTVR